MTAVAPARMALDAARAVAVALGDDVAAAYAIGSLATGGFEAGTSDLDVVAVLRRRPSRGELDDLVERVRGVEVAPARGLELVLYAGGELVLNLNVGPGMNEHVGVDAAAEPEFWFVLDRAAAEQHAVPLVGPEWREVFPPVPRKEVLDALAASLDWHEQNEPRSRNTVLNTVRTWHWLETGEWVSKPDAARWLLARVGERVERER